MRLLLARCRRGHINLDFFKLFSKRKEKQGKLSTPRHGINIVLEPGALEHYKEGKKYHDQGNYAGAIDALKQGITIEPVFTGYLNLGNCLHKLGRFNEAVSAYEAAIKIDNSDAGVHTALACSLIEGNRWDEALAFLTKTLERHQNADIYYNLGCVYSAKRMFNQAVEAYRQALTYEPRDLDALYNLGVDLLNKYFEENDSLLLEEAIVTLERCLDIDPHQSDVQADLERMRRLKAGPGIHSMESRWPRGAEKTTDGELKQGDIIPLRNGYYQYQIVEIKKGGMGVVYIARNLKTHSIGAIKTFKSMVGKKRRLLERFAQEAELWIKLDDHPNIVGAEYVERIGDRLYILLDYIDGSNLRTWIAKGKRTLHRTLDFAIQFCTGMNYAYKKLGIIHRDIKPENILLTRSGILKITDFGLAKTFVLEDRTNEMETGRQLPVVDFSLTHTGEVMGTLPYMSPEQFMAARDVGITSDIYSFGIVLYEMLSGGLPFIGRSPQEFRRLHLEQEPGSLRLTQPHLPPALDELVLRCLRKSPGVRPLDFEVLQADLSHLFWKITGDRYLDVYERGGEYRQKRVLGYSALVDKGHSLRNLKRWEEAMTCYREAASLNPDRTTPWQALAECCREMGRFKEAIEYCDQVLTLEPENSDHWGFKGAIYLKIPGHEQEAHKCLNRALAINPLDTQALVNKAACLDKLGRFEEALTCCDRVPETDPHAPDALNNKAMVLWGLNQYQDALSCLDMALEIEPEHVEARLNKHLYDSEFKDMQKAATQKYKEWLDNGLVLFRAKQYQGALECFTQAIKIDDKPPDAWVYKADVLTELGDIQKAIHCYKEALKKDNSSFDASLGLGNCLFDRGRYEEALGYFEQAINIQPENVPALISQGSSLANLGRLQEALEYFDKALAISPGDETIQEYRYMCQEYLEK